MRLLFLCFLSIYVIGCNKPDPNPELKDGIYLDMKAQLATTDKNIADFEKLLAENKANIEKVKPQTGQIKYAEKRYWEVKNAVDLLYQQRTYWKIRIAEREKYARTTYLKAFKEGKPWPDTKELEEYMAEKRLRQARQQWDVRQRIDNYKSQK
jgi:hypothetical protein